MKTLYARVYPALYLPIVVLPVHIGVVPIVLPSKWYTRISFQRVQ